MSKILAKFETTRIRFSLNATNFYHCLKRILLRMHAIFRLSMNHSSLIYLVIHLRYITERISSILCYVIRTKYRYLWSRGEEETLCQPTFYAVWIRISRGYSSVYAREFYIRCISLLRNSSKDTSWKWTTTDREHRKFDDRVRGILNFNNQVTEDGRREGTKRGKRGW